MSDDQQLTVGMDDERHDDDHLVAAYAEEPIADPGVHEHELRPTDVDEAAGKRVERQISAMFLAAGVLSVLFCVAYFTFDPQPGEAETWLGYSLSNLTLGLTLGGALLLIGIGAIQWAKKLMSDVEIIEHRHNAGSTPHDKAVALEAWNQGVAESAIGRRPLIRNSLLGATALLGLPAIVLLRDLGPLPGDSYATTVWTKGMRVVNDITGQPFKPEDMEVGQLINAEPGVFFEQEGPDGEVIEPEYEGVALNNAKAKAAVIVVRMRPQDITPLPEREDWGIDGILCYSKICTHVGCPISLWEQQTHQLLCPCHQSTFDLADNGKVLFGPAARPLPQLPIGVDEEGYVIATSGFHEPVGPSYWERG
jgi:ubiquinol-cytochrome c reductase iron-sulfur subunit